MNVSGKRKKWLAAGLILMVLLWAAWLFRSNARMARAEELGRQLATARNLPPDQRREQWGAFRQEMAKLSPEQRREVGAKVFADRRRETREKVSQYFKLPKKQQIAQLDAEINRMEEMRRQRERARAAGQGNNPSSGPMNGAGSGSRSAEQRDRMRQQRLDSSSPEDKALMTEYFKQMNQRRQQRNLPVWQGRGGG